MNNNIKGKEILVWPQNLFSFSLWKLLGKGVTDE